ncbi:MAG: cadherin-like domain-containing protein [Rhodocyclales bacterium]|nr:cadherin-like domain-containing protein [Rhodocyclales bacterium]
MSALTKFALPLMAMLGLGGCDYPKKIQEIPEPWRALESGQAPKQPPRVEILEQGEGAVVESGDLVQVRVTDWFASAGRWHDFGDWWVWVGFNSSKESVFFSYSPVIAAGLLGMRQGSKLKILDASLDVADHGFVGELHPNPFGDPKYYSWRKNTTDVLAVSPLKAAGGFSILEIKRVCKGQAQYRTVRLFDDSPVEVGPAFRMQVTREPREAWVDEAKIEAVCTDGRKAIFQYGPIPSSNGKAWKDLVQGYFDDYFRDAWKKVPKGVYFEGHPSPVATDVEFRTKQDTPVTFRILPKDQDAEGNKLTVRIVDQPDGVLTANPDGTWTFSPKAKWYGTETLRYRISDGLVVSEDGRLRLHVEKK